MKKIGVLGSTGSIGTQTLEIVRAYSEDLKVVVLAAGTNVKLMEEQMREFKPEVVVMYDEKAANDLRVKTADLNIPVLAGMDGLLEASVWDGILLIGITITTIIITLIMLGAE